MRINKEKDRGLNYLRDIGFDRIKGENGLEKRWTKIFGKERAKQLCAQRKAIKDASREFYDFKNSDIEISRSFSEAYDYDILRKSCNYIYKNKQYFGDTILEVGCDTGYMTGFLARAFPESRIVSIDRNESAIKIARQRMEEMGMHNVEFRVSSLDSVNECFDTVFCMRTIQENLNYTKAPFYGEPIVAQFLQYSQIAREYTLQLLERIKDGGTLCVFERIGHDPLMCGWMCELCNNLCSPLLETYKEIECNERENISVFQAFVCRKGLNQDTRSIMSLWYEPLRVKATGKSILKGWSALCYLNDNAGEMIRGVRIMNDDNEQVGRFALFYDKDEDSVVYYLFAPGENIELQSYNIELKELLLAHLQDAVEANETIGLHYTEISPEEEMLEGNRNSVLFKEL